MFCLRTPREQIHEQLVSIYTYKASEELVMSSHNRYINIKVIIASYLG